MSIFTYDVRVFPLGSPQATREKSRKDLTCVDVSIELTWNKGAEQ